MIAQLRLLTPALATAALAAGPSTAAILIDYNDLVDNGVHGPAVNNGDFQATPTELDPPVADNFSALGPWIPTGTNATINSRTNLPSGVGGDRNVVIGVETTGETMHFGLDTGYTLALGDIFTASYMWRDAFQWDVGETIDMVLFYTDTDLIGGTRTVLQTFNSGDEVNDQTWETESFGPTAALADAGAVGKSLFVSFETNNVGNRSFGRLDNVYLEVVPEPGSLALLGLGGLLIARRRRQA